MTTDPHKPLRDDVRLLGELLGETLREQGGAELFETVERFRALTKSARADHGTPPGRSGRQGSTDDLLSLSDALARMPVAAALPIARAFSHFLNLANVAEQHHRSRRRRHYQRDPAAAPQRGSCRESFARLLDGGLSPDALHDSVCRLRIELVFTAHPTEVARRTLVQKYNRIGRLLGDRDRPDLTTPEQEALVAALRREVHTAWGTSEVRAHRPTPIDEVRSGLIIFEQSLWDAVPRYLRTVDHALRAATGRPLPIDTSPIRFGSWIGGDRDGNPNVTPEVTRRACLLARWVAADLYVQELEALRDELSLDAASGELRARAGEAREPYRVLLRPIVARLRTTREWIERELDRGDEQAAPGEHPAPAERDGVLPYLDEAELIEPLRLCYDSLQATGYGLVADGRLADVLRRLAVFGLTLARLDVRQDATRHAGALAAITTALGLGSYLDWDEPARVAFLLRELASRRPLVPSDLDADDEVRDVLETFRAIATIPRGSLGAYVITMASSASDVLAVALLQKEAGVREPLRVVPLFETSRDLRNAGAVIDMLLSIPEYRSRVGTRQEVMIGYSDSAKDVGRLAAGWDLYRAQEAVVDAGRRHGVAITLFHGRGGSVGRGGGPTHLAIRSQPPGSIDGTLRVTEQGEMLQALFGMPEIALRTMEVYTSGTLEAWLTPPAAPPAEFRDCMDRLAADARAAYRGIVYDDPRFIEYFTASTPADEIGGLNIGSRPSTRPGASLRTGPATRPGASPGTTAPPRPAGAPTRSVGSLRAIPWQFAWTQTRLILGAWLGVEDALDGAQRRGETDLVRRMYEQWPHFQSAIGLIEMVLAKTDAAIAAEYDRRLVPEALRPLGDDLRARLARAIRGVLAVTGHAQLLESNPVLRRSIDVRNPYVDPINLVQVELLARLRRLAPSEPEGRVEGRGDDEEVRTAFMMTVNGIAAGMRNTG